MQWRRASPVKAAALPPLAPPTLLLRCPDLPSFFSPNRESGNGTCRGRTNGEKKESEGIEAVKKNKNKKFLFIYLIVFKKEVSNALISG